MASCLINLFVLKDVVKVTLVHCILNFKKSNMSYTKKVEHLNIFTFKYIILDGNIHVLIL